MSYDDDREACEDPGLESLLAFDSALANGGDPAELEVPDSPFSDVHACQLLLEAVWPRHHADLAELPRRFGRFLIIRELGRGGFGIVYLAADAMFGRKVALKVPRPEVLVTPVVRHRFVREAEAASRLDHPHIVPVYEVGEDGPICYIVSAYCEGDTLAARLRARAAPISPVTAARMMVKLAGAVAHAHERGILHRDLKPGNILLGRSLDAPLASSEEEVLLDEQPQICDFGLAKLLNDESNETNTGFPIGSPNYMSPEQACGRTRDYGPATDIYALGAILYELLTGRPPFRGESTLDTLRQVAEREPTPPSILRPRLPRDLEAICLKCLEKRPERRYASAAALADDLLRFVAGKPTLARPVSARVRARKWVRCHPVAAALITLIMLVHLSAIAGLAWNNAREKQYSATVRGLYEQARKSEAKAQEQRAVAERHERLAQRHWVAAQIKVAAETHDRGDVDIARSILETLRPEPGMPDHRAFAWSYLESLCRRVEAVGSLPATVSQLAHSPDGKMLALADVQANAFVVDLNSGQSRRMQGKHRQPGSQVLAFSPDGRTLASLKNEQEDRRWTSRVKLWDVGSGDEWQGLPDDFILTYQLLFSGDGQTLITLEAAAVKPAAPLRAWKLDHRLKRATLDSSLAWAQVKEQLPSAHEAATARRRPNAFSERLAFAPEGATLAVFLADGEVRLIPEGNGYCNAVCRVRGSEVVVVPRTDLAVPASKVELDRMCRIAGAVTGGLKPRLLLADLAVRFARFSDDGRTAAILLPNPDHVTRGILRLIDVDSGRVLATFPGSNVSFAARFDFAPDGGSLVITEFDSRARRWNFNKRPEPLELQGHTGEVWGLAFSPDGRTLASSSDDHTIKLWDMPSGRERATLTGHGNLVTMVKYAPDGRLIASSGFDKKVRLWDSVTGKPIAVLEGHTDLVRVIAFSPDGQTLASAGSDRSVRLWDVATRQAIGSPLDGHSAWVLSLAFSPDSKTLYTGGTDETIRLWDRDTGRAVAIWRTKVQSLSFALSPDGQTLASTEPGGNVSLWDTTRAKAGPAFRGHSLEVLGAAFSPDGRTLATAGRDRSVRLWDPETGQELIELKGHHDQVRPVVFSPDGATLASGSYDGTILLWKADSAAKPEPDQ